MSQCRRLCNQEFSESVASTLGAQYNTINFSHNGKLYNVMLWDTAGQERFANIMPLYMRGADAVIVCKELEKDVPRYIMDHIEANSLNYVNVLTKCDSHSFEEIGYISTSAKTGQGVTELLCSLGEIFTKPTADIVRCLLIFFYSLLTARQLGEYLKCAKTPKKFCPALHSMPSDAV